ncbi:MAG: polysulfide reductase NrfD [Thaumarchaeota archaeon]|jgi:molybdopterin-containing oxidoreductase family membrane subunit|nr:polysulfide reductase NrfD [Candidatus Geocrenenecus arthurdayi]
MTETRSHYIPTPFTTSSAVFLLFLLAVVGLAFNAWITQLREGLAVTGLNRPAAWGIYMANFVFFISVSMSGTFISAVIRLLKLEWGKPISRVAEILTVGSLLMAALNILFDVGQLWRALLYIPTYGRIQSPVGWDTIVLLFYLLMSLGYLHLSVIPDAAVLSEAGGRLSWLYNLLRYDWVGEEEQVHLLENALKILGVVTIPIAIMMHTVTGWIFGIMKSVPTWNDALMGPYFIIGALLTGLSLVILTSAVIRWRYHLRDIITDYSFVQLSKLLVVFSLAYLYFLMAETFTVRYASVIEDIQVSQFIWLGLYSPLTWYMLASLVIPSVVLLIPRFRTYKVTVVMAGIVLPAMWVKRVLIIVPGLLNQLRLPTVQSAIPQYVPTLTEASLTIGSFAGLALVVYVFTKLFPPVPAWEIWGVKKLAESHPPIFSLKSVFLGWVVGITTSTGYLFVLVVSTIALGSESALYVYAVRPEKLQILNTPIMVNTPMLNLLVIVVLSGLAVLFFRKIFHGK